MKITAQARNYALKHGVHIYGLTSEESKALVFYDIESDQKLCSYKTYSDAPLQKSLNHAIGADVFDKLPGDIRTAQGVQKVIDLLLWSGYARKLDEDEIAEARNKILTRSTGVSIS